MQMSVLILAFVTIHIGIVIQAEELCAGLDISALQTRCELGELECNAEPGCSNGEWDCTAMIKFKGGMDPIWAGSVTDAGTGTEEDIQASVSVTENYAVSRYYQYDSNSHQMRVINGSKQDLLVSKYVFYSLVSYGLGATILVVALACKLRQMSKMKKALKHGHQNVPIHEMDVDSNCGITKQ
eukprot:403904_1